MLKPMHWHAYLLMTLAVCIVALYSGVPGLREELHAAVELIARADIGPLRDHLLSYGWLAPAASAVLQLVTSILAPLPSFVLAFVNALLFGFWWGALLTFSTALAASLICFALARALGRPVVERLATRRLLEPVDAFFARHGASAVLVARLIPFMNPDVVSYAAGLTPIRWRLFLLMIALGSLPSTALYSYLGARGVTSVGWLLLPLVVLGLGALAFSVWQARRTDARVARLPANRQL